MRSRPRIKKEKKPQDKWTAAVQILAAAAAVGLFAMSMFVSREEMNNSPLLHSLQIFFTSLAALAAIAVLYLMRRNKRKSD